MSIDRLIDNIRKKRNPTIMGLDPKLEYIPDHIKNEQFEKHGETLKAAAEAIFEFNRGLIDATYDIIPAIKPQCAFYERFGPEGMAALKKTVDYAREKGLYVVVDGKRNDIGSTAEAYADAYLGKVKVGSKEYSAFETDALIVSAYLGSDGIKPFLKLCADNGKGMFVLVKTSNPSSIEIQDMIAGDRPFYRVVASYCERWGKPYVGKYGFSTLGAVVGATFPQQLKELRKAHPSLFFLVPGYGAQGGSAADVAGAFNAEGLGAVINSSRGIMCAYQNKGIDGTFYAEAALDACITMRDELRQFIPMA